MIKFTAQAKDGKTLIGLGITSENLGAMSQGKPLIVRCEDLKRHENGKEIPFPYPIEIMLIYGRTEEDLQKILAPVIGPETEMRRDC
jgi:hypothetical protein